MDLIQWAISPWGCRIPIHIAWLLGWVCTAAAVLFMVGHAIYVAAIAKPRKFAANDSPEVLASVPERVPRHSFVSRAFHWLMATSMFALLLTAFLPKVGIRFNWVTIHWIAGLVLSALVLFHLVHASFFLDFMSIWPDKTDVRDSMRRLRRAFGRNSPLPGRFAKYPPENKLFHFLILCTGLAAIGTGLCMMKHVNTFGIFVRNPYVFGDLAYGLIYVLHGLAGVGLIALIMVHSYFGVRPEKLPITKSMVFGYMDREYFLEEHDPVRCGNGKNGEGQF
jgi:cytochrome b subunit of formate dehydrogenase